MANISLNKKVLLHIHIWNKTETWFKSTFTFISKNIYYKNPKKIKKKLKVYKLVKKLKFKCFVSNLRLSCVIYLPN